ncbi:hypothetical protein Achl_4451 (plasmid) [Pseudarthrobacter chlorophenolicus A6]|uniref:Secreted protein n=1 Tax=Pseudarthrobacter chlorophenolicus (strain ATCC 700700 / DSM 12829 / CIP 107037 / JCM 12360 / KCTC 9906 / NCIMB 13794 / A6) TaxID=452863 RepID=B8HJ05_PSECP|nr:hypothetical protein [Pseudarthrobacter chlorophenolicus]ACL42402.1 hypothetical protein Achl_4451 [Pseudarthrobacter chlorophenolicus A6]SDQ17648.1 hypothetical protein SAMN04489738_0508 [Pseudarthrobacter chlorophenolicus]
MKRKLTSLALGTAVVTALMLPLSAGPASAAPNGCYAGGGYTYATAFCSGGTGSYQAYAVCFQSYWPFFQTFVQSDWKRAGSGQTAWVWCPFGYNVKSRGVGLRN